MITRPKIKTKWYSPRFLAVALYRLRKKKRSDLPPYIIDPWITDIQTGLSPGMTITGGPTYVADYLGTLRRTPAGYAAIEGGRYVTTLADGAVLGSELISDTALDSAAAWTITETNPASDVTFAGGEVRFQSDGTLAQIATAFVITAGRRYQYTVVCSARSSGALTVGIGGPEAVGVINAVGTFTGELGPALASTTAVLKRGAVCDVTVSSFSVREIIPQWLPAPAEPSILVPTRKGLRTVYNDPGYLGPLIEPAATNKITCVKANPTATTNITQTGDGAAVLSVVSDPSTYLANAGLAAVCSTGKLYKWDNSLGVGAAIAVLGGTTANVNPHSFSMYIIAAVGAGTVYLRTDAADAVAIPSTFQRLTKDNVTPDTTARQVRIAIDAGAVVYFILPQLEELPYTSSVIIGTNTAAAQTRAAVVTSAPTAGVFPASGQDFAIFMRVVPSVGQLSGQLSANIFGTRIDSNNYLQCFFPNEYTSVLFRSVVSSVLLGITSPVTYSIGDYIELILIRSSEGMSIRTRTNSGVWSAYVSSTEAQAKIPSIIASTYQIGAMSGSFVVSANCPITAIVQMPPKATLTEYQTWIEGELTRRGLI